MKSFNDFIMEDLNISKEFKQFFEQDETYSATLTDWNGVDTIIEIKKEWIDDIVSAVEGQYFVASKSLGLCFDGGRFKQVKIYKNGKKANVQTNKQSRTNDKRTID